MMKRILSFVLAAVLLVGLVPATTLTASAATMTTSNSGIAMIKGFEGFSAKPYQHGTQWYVGYGTRINTADKNLYSTGITTKAAEELMKAHLKDVVEPALNTFITTNNRPLSQTQFDALASLSYNIGTGWLTSSSSVIRSYVLQQKGGDQFVQTLVERNSLDPSSDYFPGLVSRRLKEANLYLNGTYNSTGNYTYVVLKDDDGAVLDATDSVLVINTKSLPAMPEAPSSPEAFLGWYTRSYTSSGALAKEEPVYSLSGMGGKTLWPKWNGDSSYTINANKLISTKVYDVTDPATITDTTKAVCNLMANSSFKVEKEKVVQNIKWAYGTGKDTKGAYCQGWVAVHDNDSVSGNSSVKVIASATITVATDGWPNPIYSGTPVTNFPVGTVLKVVEKRKDATNAKKIWGRVVYGDGGYDYLWVDLDCAKVIDDNYNDTNPYLGKSATVTNCAQLNVRNAAGVAGTTIIARIASGTKVTIYDTADVEGKLWARIKWGEANEGWVYTYYLNVTGVSNGAATGGSTKPDVLLYTGIVTSNTNLNVRQSPAVTAPWVTSLPTGTKVNIYEVTTTLGHRWGRMDKGWVCLDYVNLTQVQQSTTPTTPGNGTTGAGTAVTMSDVNAYQEADNNSKVMFTLKKGESIAISEQVPQKTASGSKIWGKVTVNGVSGWVNMAYVEVQTITVVPPAEESGSNSGIDPVNGTAGVIANASIPVNVRIAAGVQNDKVASLAVGTAVTVYELTEVNGAQWARIKWNGNNGWVAKQYVNLTGGIGGTGSSNTANGTTPGQISLTGTVNSNINLNVRSGAGLSYPQVTSLAKGTKVTVYEQVTADGMLWGKINVNGTAGWVCMSYISVEQTNNSGTGVMGTIARCFDSVNVRSAPGVGNAIVGKLKVGTRVEIFEQRLYSAQYWGRVAQGWICMEYVVTDGIVPEGPINNQTTQETTVSSDSNVNNNKELVYNVKATTTTNRQYVYKDATDKSGVAGTIDANMPVTILAFKADGDKTWGKINDYNTPGWINLNGVTFPSRTGYINSDNQPVYAKPDSSSTTIQVLSCGTEVKYINYAMFGDVPFVGLTTDSTNVTGWVPMSKISDTAINIALTFSAAHAVETANGSGKTMVLTEVLESPNSANVVFKLAAMSDVTFCLQMDKTSVTRADGGKVWVKVAADSSRIGWLDVSKLSFTAAYSIGVPFNIRVDSSMDSTIVGRKSAGSIPISSVACDAFGNVWGKIASADAALNNYWFRLDGKDQPTAVTSTELVSGTTAYGVTSGIVNAYTTVSGTDVLFQLAAGTRVSFDGREYSTAPGARVKIRALGSDAYVNASDLASFALSAFVTTADSAVYDGTGTEKIRVATLQTGSPVTITGIVVDSGNTYFNIGIGYIQSDCIGVINP